MGSHAPVEFTASDWAFRFGITRRAAARWLEDRVRIGKLKKRFKMFKSGPRRNLTAFYSEVKSGHAGRNRRMDRMGRGRRSRLVAEAPDA